MQTSSWVLCPTCWGEQSLLERCKGGGRLCGCLGDGRSLLPATQPTPLFLRRCSISMGGMVALWLAAHHGSAVGSIVASEADACRPYNYGLAAWQVITLRHQYQQQPSRPCPLLGKQRCFCRLFNHPAAPYCHAAATSYGKGAPEPEGGIDAMLE